MNKFLLCLLLIGLSSTLFAQKIIALDKPGKVKRIRYYQGDIIHLMNDEGRIYKGEIQEIKDSSFIVNNDELFLYEIIYIRNTQGKNGWFFLTNLFIKSGLAYHIAFNGNRLLQGEYDKIASAETAIVTSSALLGAIISYQIATRRYRLNKYRTLKIINLEI